MDSSPTLTLLQRDLLREFFAREQRLFLTGGAALAGFDFHHRKTDDLDLFAAPPVDLDEAERTLGDVAVVLNASLHAVSRHTDFRRWRVERDAESCLVDFVLDRAPMVDAQKRQIGTARIDTLREMTANKVRALISRSELRDLVDLRVLLGAGHSLELALTDAATKEASADAATLGYTQSQLSIRPDAVLPSNVDAVALEAFRAELVARLRTLARNDAT
jgi:hypothetical protein